MFSIACYNKGHFAIYTVSLGYSGEKTNGASPLLTPFLAVRRPVPTQTGDLQNAIYLR